jgi:poly-gamma-glutamate capsule biosynthesis protein CapA/YwtB (metallophosphatase superfamily)
LLLNSQASLVEAVCGLLNTGPPKIGTLPDSNMLVAALSNNLTQQLGVENEAQKIQVRFRQLVEMKK